MLSRIALITALTTAMVVPVFAADDYRWSRDRRDRDDYRYDRGRDRDRDRDRRNDRYGYGYGNNSRNDSGYGYGRQNDRGVIDRTLRNLQVAASRNRVDSHERDHFNRAMSELRNMQYNRGNTDYRRLDRVLEDLEHLSRADQVHPRDRQILARDRQSLYSLRGGYGYNR